MRFLACRRVYVGKSHACFRCRDCDHDLRGESVHGHVHAFQRYCNRGHDHDLASHRGHGHESGRDDGNGRDHDHGDGRESQTQIFPIN